MAQFPECLCVALSVLVYARAQPLSGRLTSPQRRSGVVTALPAALPAMKLRCHGPAGQPARIKRRAEVLASCFATGAPSQVLLSLPRRLARRPAVQQPPRSTRPWREADSPVPGSPPAAAGRPWRQPRNGGPAAAATWPGPRSYQSNRSSRCSATPPASLSRLIGLRLLLPLGRLP